MHHMGTWISTPDGLFAEQPHPKHPDRVLIRCRTREDAERLMLRVGAGIVVRPPERGWGTAIVLPKVVWTVYVAFVCEDDPGPHDPDAALPGLI